MKEIKKYLLTRNGEYSFYFEDVESGYSYGFNEIEKMPSASCIKVPIAMSLLKEVQEGGISFQKKVAVKNEDMVEGGVGIINEFLERDYTIGELFLAMLIQSDNTATNKIIELLTMKKINSRFKEMGLTGTELKSKMKDIQLVEDVMENYTTSLDMARCFKLLYGKKYLNENNSELLINALKKQQRRHKIPFYIPKELWKNIANKTGSLNNVENDSALITIPKGNFIFTVMSKTLPSNVYGIVTLERVGKMMWDIVDKSWN